MRQLASRLGLEHPAFRESDEDIAAGVLPSGWSLDELEEKNWRKSASSRPAIAALEKRLRLADSPLNVPAKPKSGEFRLLTPKSHYFLNSTFANMARHRQAQGLPTATMNSADAAACAFASGAKVVIRGAAGHVVAHLKVSDTVRSGIILLEGKWWDGGNPGAPSMNRLTPSAWSPAGQPAYNEGFVTIEPR